MREARRVADRFTRRGADAYLFATAWQGRSMSDPVEDLASARSLREMAGRT